MCPSPGESTTPQTVIPQNTRGQRESGVKHSSCFMLSSRLTEFFSYLLFPISYFKRVFSFSTRGFPAYRYKAVAFPHLLSVFYHYSLLSLSFLSKRISEYDYEHFIAGFHYFGRVCAPDQISYYNSHGSSRSSSCSCFLTATISTVRGSCLHQPHASAVRASSLPLPHAVLYPYFFRYPTAVPHNHSSRSPSPLNLGFGS